MNEIPPCPICGTEFDDIFEATDHLIEDEDGEEFDPVLILPNGYRLMIGSLLRCLYSYANDPEQIEAITQSTYATLYAAETNPKEMRSFIEDMVIREQMHGFDKELSTLLDDEKPTNDESGE
jgi:hypothetical protein